MIKRLFNGVSSPQTAAPDGWSHGSDHWHHRDTVSNRRAHEQLHGVANLGLIYIIKPSTAVLQVLYGNIDHQVLAQRAM